MSADDDLADLVRSAAEAVAHRHAGLLVAAVSGGRTAVHGTGTTGTHGGTAPTSGTLFQIGSLTKVVTALALAAATTRGDLSYDTPVDDLLPPLPPSAPGPRITLAHLTSHTSGLSGVALLGHALARRAGTSWERLVATEVTGPLGLHGTVPAVGPSQQDRRATGHSRGGRLVPDWDLAAVAPAGGLWSSGHDVLALVRAHLEPGDGELSGALRMVQQPRARATRWLQVCSGWMLTPLRGSPHPVLWHDGGTGGSSSFAGFQPDVGVGVVVLSSTARSVDRAAMSLLTTLVERAAT